MKFKRPFFIKLLIALFSVLVVIIIVVWLVLPSQLKVYIEENDREWINRDIFINKIELNPFTFNLKVNNVEVKEPNSKGEFITFDDLIVDFDFWALTKSKLIIEKVKLDKLFVNIQQSENQFNFSDLLEKKEVEEEIKPTNFELHNIQISNSVIHYSDNLIGSKIVLDSIHIKDEVYRSLDSVIDLDVSIHQPEGGFVKGGFTYNLETSAYKINTTIETWKLAPFKKYVTSVIKLSNFEGKLDADLKLLGNIQASTIDSNGKITVSDFKMVDPEEKPLINVEKFYLDITEINNKENIYDFKDILADNLNVNFEYLPNGDNFSKHIVTTATAKNEKHTSSDYYMSPFEMLSVYIYDMTKEYIFKSYTAEKIALTNFNLKFYDYTLEDPFHMDLEGLSIKAQNIKPENQFAKFYIDGKMNSTAKIKGDLSVSREGVENMNINMAVNGLFLNRFSPYSRMYTAHRLVEGVTSFKNKSEIKDSYLKSTNIFHIENAVVSKKDKVKNGSSLPMRLAVALMRDTKGNIDLDIPIEGPINDPEYKFGKVIWQIIKNLFTKAVTSPVKSLANIFKIDEKELKNIYFDNGQIGLSPLQKKPLNNIAKVLNKKKNLQIQLNHLYNKEYEFDAIALKSAKLSYLKQSNLKLDKTIPIGKLAFDLSSTDPDFLLFLKKNTANYDETISTPENARRLIGNEVVKQELENVISKQKALIKNYLEKEKQIAQGRFIIKDGANTEAALNQSRPKFEVNFEIEQ